MCRRGTSGHGLVVDLAVLGSLFDLIILKVFCSLNYSMTPRLARESCLTDLWRCPRLSREFIWYNRALCCSCCCSTIRVLLHTSSCLDEYIGTQHISEKR